MANSVICFLSFFIFICFSLPTSVTSSSSNETDVISLLAIKSSLNDPNGALNSWNQTTTHYCNWTGIRCGGRHTNRVVKIKLQSQGLVGSLSPYIDLLKAIGGFSESSLIGVGRFGSVYKGILKDGETLVAVKVLNLFVRGASKSFMAEYNALRGVRHRNLVKILSVCESIDFQGNDFKALVYEFKSNGSLEKWLYHYREEEEGESGEEMMRKLSIIQRLNIAIDIAQAVEYLHCGTDSTIVHGDLKPSNILLDDEMTACVGDFGLAKIVSEIVPSYESTSSIGIRGTLGYIPPEYGMSSSVSTQGDVYSYGIILLEIFTNVRPTDNLFKDHGNLHSFVSAALSDHVMEILDPVFQAELDVENVKIIDYMSSILSIGVSCSKEMPKDRMSMTDVVVQLLKIKKVVI